MPKRPDYGDAIPEDLAISLMRLQRPPLKKRPESDKEQENSDQKKENPIRDSVSEQS